MLLQTHIRLSPEKNQIDYGSKVLLLGSCFTENIGEKLAYFKFQNMQNPFGIVFHPLAIEQLVNRAVNKVYFTEADVFERDEHWFCFEAHSSVTAVSRAALLEQLNSRLRNFSTYLLEASHIVFTYGTAWVYRHVASDTVVANCHKIPQKEFTKELLSVQEISASIERTTLYISQINPSASIITTISPVRHSKDGFVENTRSKSHLIAGFHQGSNLQSNYFPSFEIMMDELRDYRFYTDDMLHPSAMAIEYIWEKFAGVWIASETEQLQKQIETIQKGLQHKPFYPDSVSHLKFQQDLEQKIEKVRTKLPFVHFD